MFGWLKRLFGTSGSRRLSASHRRLVNRLRGDEAAAERLIRFEIQRAPELTRDEATRRAIDRLEYERSR
jgi:hypothetical protein